MNYSRNHSLELFKEKKCSKWCNFRLYILSDFFHSLSYSTLCYGIVSNTAYHAFTNLAHISETSRMLKAAALKPLLFFLSCSWTCVGVSRLLLMARSWHPAGAAQYQQGLPCPQMWTAFSNCSAVRHFDFKVWF